LQKGGSRTTGQTEYRTEARIPRWRGGINEKGDWTMIDDRVSGSVLDSALDIRTELVASGEWADVTA
jgi:hypothetical protein